MVNPDRSPALAPGPDPPPAPVCPRCGYDLRGIPEDTCPECGLGYQYRAIENLALYAADDMIRSYERSFRICAWAVVAAVPPGGVLIALAPVFGALLSWLFNRDRDYPLVPRFGIVQFSLMIGIGVISIPFASTPLGAFQFLVVALLFAWSAAGAFPGDGKFPSTGELPNVLESLPPGPAAYLTNRRRVARGALGVALLALTVRLCL